jgi:hypothetical protein
MLIKIISFFLFIYFFIYLFFHIIIFIIYNLLYLIHPNILFHVFLQYVLIHNNNFEIFFHNIDNEKHHFFIIYSLNLIYFLLFFLQLNLNFS